MSNDKLRQLTAEQVREAIEENSWEETFMLREFNDSSWQGIADELNATLGAGTCRFKPLSGEDWNEPNSVRGTCSECSALMYGKDNYCPNCGRKVDTQTA